MTGGELGPEARALLDAARDGLSPDAAAMRRVRARVDATAAGAATAATAGKLGLIALVAAVAVGAGLHVARAPAPAAAAAAPPAVEPASPLEQPQRAAVREPAPAGSDADLITIEDVPAAAPRPRSAPRRPAPPSSTTAPAAAAVHPIELGREVALVDQAMAGLRGGDALGALRVIAQYDREAAGAGQLTEDAAAIEIEALCALRDPAARGKLAAFDRRFPRSVQRARLGLGCR